MTLSVIISVPTIFWDFFTLWWDLKAYPRVVECQNFLGLGPPRAGLGPPEVLAHFIVVKMRYAAASPQGMGGPKLVGTFTYPQTPLGYH